MGALQVRGQRQVRDNALAMDPNRGAGAPAPMDSRPRRAIEHGRTEPSRGCDCDRLPSMAQGRAWARAHRSTASGRSNVRGLTGAQDARERPCSGLEFVWVRGAQVAGELAQRREPLCSKLHERNSHIGAPSSRAQLRHGTTAAGDPARPHNTHSLPHARTRPAQACRCQEAVTQPLLTRGLLPAASRRASGPRAFCSPVSSATSRQGARPATRCAPPHVRRRKSDFGGRPTRPCSYSCETGRREGTRRTHQGWGRCPGTSPPRPERRSRLRQHPSPTA
mgnify:CR=1 FL=1